MLDVADLCCALVRIPSLSGQERESAEFAAHLMAVLGFNVGTDEYGDVIGVRRGYGPGPTILLDAHLDVVPVTNPDEWRHAPFDVEIADGRIWGRGAADTKGSLAAMICAAASLPRESFVGQIVVSASVCEENMTGAALSRVLDRHCPDVVIVGEPTGLKLGVAQKGRAGLVVEARGKSAHSSRPELGDNAVYKMIQAVNRIRALPLSSDPAIGPSVCELTELVSEPLPGTGMVPHGCRARFALRIMPGETAHELVERFRTVLNRLDGVTVRLDEISQRCYTGNTLVMPDYVPGWKLGPVNGPWQDKIEQGIKLAGLRAETFAAPYSTNGSASAGQRGISTFIFGPGSIEQAHMVDEWIAIEELQTGEQAYAAMIHTCLQV